MSLLKEIARAKRHLESSVRNLLEAPLNYSMGTINISNSYQAHVAALKHNAKKSKKNLYRLERKLLKIKNHAPTPRIELIVIFMIIFKPEIKEEIGKIVTLT